MLKVFLQFFCSTTTFSNVLNFCAPGLNHSFAVPILAMLKHAMFKAFA